MPHLSQRMPQRLLSRPMIAWLVLLTWMSVGCTALSPPGPADARTDGTLPHPTASPTPAEFPATLARVRLAFEQNKIIDARLHADQHVLYVAESGGALHVLDVDSLVEVITLPVSGRLTLDGAQGRLYVAQTETISVVDTDTYEIIATLPGSHVAMDATNNRLYVGNVAAASAGADAAGVRLYDGDTLTLRQTGAQPGIPVYNPVRNELLIVAYTVYTADPETLAVRTDLLPEIGQQALPWCNGCLAAQEATVFPAENLLALELTRLATGGGAGLQPAPIFLDAATLQSDPVASATRSLQHTCNSQRSLRPAVDGRFYRSQIFQRYVTFTNLSVVDEMGAPVTWRDGLDAGFVNDRTGHGYLSLGEDGLRVLDLGTLQPLGVLDATCILLADEETGRLYAAQGGALYVYGERGGVRKPLPPIAEPLPAAPIENIYVSPAYADDRTLFVSTAYGRIYRSTDGGENWARLRGGLPESIRPDGLHMMLAISPDFGRDQTLFAAGHRGTARGEGVWRSTDGGETWQPMWRDLLHLRVDALHLSPDFATDNTLLADAAYDQLDRGAAGVSRFRSTDRGLHWSLVATDTMASALPPQAETALPLRVDGTGRGLERQAADGAWQPVPSPLRPDSYIRAILPAAEDGSLLYVAGEFDVALTADGGTTWERWDDPLLAPRDYTNAITVAALTPPLDDGSQHLLIGTQDGDLWAVPPDAATWEND